MAEIIRGLSIEAYHADLEHVSCSRLKDFAARGPAYYAERYLTGTIEREETSALVFGQAFETLVQEGHARFSETYVVKPPHARDGRTKEAKAWAAAQAGKIILGEDEMDAMLRMHATLNATEELRDGMDLVRQCEPQVTLRGAMHGVPIQCRPDWAHLDDFAPYTVDLKTTKDLGDLVDEATGECGPALIRLGYHVQAALVRRLMAQNGFPDATAYLLIVEKQPAYRAAFVNIESLLAAGERYLDEHLPRLAACLTEKRFPRAPRGIVQLRAPRWLDPQPTP